MLLVLRVFWGQRKFQKQSDLHYKAISFREYSQFLQSWLFDRKQDACQLSNPTPTCQAHCSWNWIVRTCFIESQTYSRSRWRHVPSKFDFKYVKNSSSFSLAPLPGYLLAVLTDGRVFPTQMLLPGNFVAIHAFWIERGQVTAWGQEWLPLDTTSCGQLKSECVWHARRWLSLLHDQQNKVTNIHVHSARRDSNIT